MPVLGRVCQNPVQTTLIWIGTILGMAESCGFWLVCRSVLFRLDGIWTVRIKAAGRRGIVLLGAGVLLAWTCGVALIPDIAVCSWSELAAWLGIGEAERRPGGRVVAAWWGCCGGVM